MCGYESKLSVYSSCVVILGNGFLLKIHAVGPSDLSSFLKCPHYGADSLCLIIRNVCFNVSRATGVKRQILMSIRVFVVDVVCLFFYLKYFQIQEIQFSFTVIHFELYAWV